MGNGAYGGECGGDDGIDTVNRDYITAIVLRWNEYDFCVVCTWANFATFMLYWKGGNK